MDREGGWKLINISERSANHSEILKINPLLVPWLRGNLRYMNTRVVGDVIVVNGISVILFQCIYYSEVHKMNKMSEEGNVENPSKLEFHVALDAFDARDSQVYRFLWAVLYYCISIFIAFMSSCAYYAILWCGRGRVSYLIFSYEFSRWMAFVILWKIFQFPMSSHSHQWHNQTTHSHATEIFDMFGAVAVLVTVKF